MVMVVPSSTDPVSLAEDVDGPLWQPARTSAPAKSATAARVRELIVPPDTTGGELSFGE